MTSAGSMHEVGHSRPLLWDNPAGWGGEGAGRRVHNRWTRASWLTDADSVYGKNHHNVVKLSSN